MRRNYYWITAIDPETRKPYLIFGGNSEDDARHKGLEMLAGVDFEIKALPTRDIHTASSMLKGNKLEKTCSLKKASERLGHDRSLSRLRRRRNYGN